MGGFYGKLLIAAYSTFIALMTGLVFMDIVFGKKDDKTPSSE
ncbi:hypothetical protein B188_06490 [Candidatus Brocadiaceae bacterium B188]|nr:hypothetical protein B188_06490 [Candidatus Brocadiaceae bacterium B188]